MEIINLAWDSEFFNLKIGKLLIKDGKTFNQELLNDTDFDLLYIMSYTPLEVNEKIKLVDQKALYELKNKSIDIDLGFVDSVKVYNKNFVSEDLLSLAIQSGEFSRFRLDNIFPESKFEKLYQTWIEKSVNGVMADKVYVVYEDNKEIGFATSQSNNNSLQIGLIATDKKYRGKQIGGKLIQKIISDFKKSNFENIIVYTQLDNVPACKFYEKYGFSLSSIEYIYHYWL